jgi:tryptophan-rich sensory protein
MNTANITSNNKALVRAIALSIPIILLGFLSGMSTTTEIQTWYVYLQKPSFNPPNYIFGPVWSLLYILMGISLSIIIGAAPSRMRTMAILIFIVQFILNLGWSYIFFNLHLTGLAFIEIILMWVAIISMINYFYKVNKTAALLQIPYALWVTFASVLNYSIYVLN